MAKDLNKGLDDARTTLLGFDSAGINAFKNGHGFTFFKWDPPPYTGLQFDPEHPGAWFLYLPRKFPDNITEPPYQSRWPTVDAMLDAINHSLVGDPQPQRPDYKDPPTSVEALTADGSTTVHVDLTDGVFFPLYLIDVGGGAIEWSTYFERRHNHPEFTPKLCDVILTGVAARQSATTRVSGDIPGFFIAGDEALPIQLLRPKVRL
jgi:hypothetical protein